MKKKIAIFRYGVPAPLKKETKIVEKISGEHFELACLTTIVGDLGIISLVYSDWTVSDIAAEFQRVAEETGDFLPISIFELDNGIIEFGPAGEHLRFTLENFNNEVDALKTQINLSLDELLELVSKKGGIDKLNSEEKELLNRLSNNL